MKKYKCIIFDCDGVLVDSEILGNQVMVDMAIEFGANIDLSFALKNFKGGFLKDCVQQVEGISGKPLPKNFEEQYRKRSFEIFKEKLKPVNGIQKVLDNLDIPFCTASSGPQEKIKLNLKTTGLRHYFQDNIFSCYDIGKWKPDPAIFLYAAGVMGCQVEDCLVVEDTITGINAAVAGGFDVFGFAAHDVEEDFENKPTKVLYDMDELISML